MQFPSLHYFFEDQLLSIVQKQVWQSKLLLIYPLLIVI